MNRDNLHTYRFRLTTLSPVHIGTGEVYEPTNFMIDQGRFYGFDEVLFYQHLTDDEKKIFHSKIDDWMSIIDFYRSKAKKAKSLSSFNIKVSQDVELTYKKLRNKDGSERKNQFQIATTFKNSNTNNPIIPGSSIKGMFDTLFDIDSQQIASNVPRQHLIISDTQYISGAMEIGYAYRQHKNLERSVKSEIPQILEVISKGSVFEFEMKTEYDFCKILEKVSQYYKERDKSKYQETETSFTARIGKFSGKAYMVRDGKNVLNNDGKPVATHTLYEKKEPFGWIKLELIEGKGCNKEEKEEKIIERLEALEKKLENTLSGKSIKLVYKIDKLSEQIGQSPDTIQNIIKEYNIHDNQGVLKTEDVKKIVEILLAQYRGVQIKNLAAEMNISVAEILSFAEEENIDIRTGDSFISIEIAEIIRKYL